MCRSLWPAAVCLTTERIPGVHSTIIHIVPVAPSYSKTPCVPLSQSTTVYYTRYQCKKTVNAASPEVISTSRFLFSSSTYCCSLLLSLLILHVVKVQRGARNDILQSKIE
ncbi:hypothetical protein G9C98_007517 [Cotesia typhae]|uniref:Uncharacterized protein n=1 Tax=Cotesia typhae TaxID=2053667 RepID=A0A8J5UW56_9HYME|nr:hypothetical protein G9C98_007517 [Cotesia typhae]